MTLLPLQVRNSTETQFTCLLCFAFFSSYRLIRSLKEELELLRSKGEAERIRLQQLDPIINTMMDERALVEYLLERGQEQNKKRS
ncbi:hypothetical protein AB4K20DRAFT_1911858 [Rhizopus microsporus]